MALKSFIPERTHRHPGLRAATWILSALLCVIAVPQARAGFVGAYAPGNFTFTDVIGTAPDLGYPNGSAVFLDVNTLVLTGSNDGSGLEGTTDLMIRAAGSGLFQFDYRFVDLVPPLPDPLNPIDIYAFPYGGYLIGGNFVQLSDALGATGSVSVSIEAGELIGFRVGGDDTGGPGVLTITNFSAPVPEPGTFLLLLLTAAVAAAGNWRRLRLELCRSRRV